LLPASHFLEKVAARDDRPVVVEELARELSFLFGAGRDGTM
jgi:hypothetical protein